MTSQSSQLEKIKDNNKEVKEVIFNDLAAKFNLSSKWFASLNYFESSTVQKVLNHPVHIIDEKGDVSPSALIPFCEFGGSNSVLGINSGIRNFNVTVCNSFQAKILNDQLCYEVDLSKYSNKSNIERELKLGFNFIMDYNEDRQISFDQSVSVETDMNLATSVVESNENLHAFIYLDTIGKWQKYV